MDRPLRGLAPRSCSVKLSFRSLDGRRGLCLLYPSFLGSSSRWRRRLADAFVVLDIVVERREVVVVHLFDLKVFLFRSVDPH